MKRAVLLVGLLLAVVLGSCGSPVKPHPPRHRTNPHVTPNVQSRAAALNLDSNSVGRILAVTTGTWTGQPTGFTYAWQRCDAAGSGCGAIPGATVASYTIATADIGHVVAVLVSACNAGGCSSIQVVAGLVASTTSATCTVTDSTLASIVSDSASLANGAKLCVANGSYGQLNLTAARSGYVTIAAVNQGQAVFSGLDISSAASFLHLDGLTVNSNSEFGTSANNGSAPHDIIVTNTVSQGFQVEAGAVNYTFDHDKSTGGPYGFLLNGSRYPVAGGCCSTANYPLIQHVSISNSIVGPVGDTGADAFQVKGFDDVTISNNEITGIFQNGNHNDGVQTVHGGANLTITHNWFHNGNIETFMIKDGSITGANAMTDNLVENENPANNPACGGCSTAVSGQLMGPVNWTISKNTFVEPPFVIESDVGLVGNGNPNYLPVSNIDLDHNVITMFRPQDYDAADAEGVFTSAMSESYNIFGSWTTNWITPNPTDTINTSPTFMCGSNCEPNGSGSPDYRLATNPNGIGIDWSPATQTYGPG